ncbi:MAG: hypothetical protein IKT40_12595 [Bacilli bacterium]|nr:hypothetical protein [Bacilli bacterium]
MRNSILKLQRGQFISVVTNYPTTKVDDDLYKKIDKMPNPMFGRITKRTEFSGVRVCEYENMAQVIAEREQGKEAREPWYDWVNFPYIAVGKKNLNEYLVVKTTPTMQTKVTYFVDGIETDYSLIEKYFKAKSKGEMPRVLTLQLDYIESFKQGEIVYKK